MLVAWCRAFQFVGSQSMSVFCLVIACGLAAPPTVAEVSRWIAELGDSRYAIREQAIKQLWEAGPVAESAVRKAAESADPEISRRAKQLVEKYDWGIFPNTPPDVVAQISRYRGSDDDGKHQAIRALIALGRPGYPAVGRLAARAETITERAVIGQAMSVAVRDVLPKHIRAGDLVAAEELLDACLISDETAIVDHYVAVVLLTGRMTEARSLWTERLKQGKPRAVDVTYALARAAGEFSMARTIAETARRPELVEQTLWDMADWKELASREFPTNHDRPQTPAHDLSLKAYLQRLAGDADGAAKSLEALRQVKSRPEEASERLVAAHGLLANERVSDALTILQSLGMRSEQYALLYARGDFAGALAAAEQQSPEVVDDRRAVPRLSAASTYAQLGNMDRAKTIFDGIAQEAVAPVDPQNLVFLLRFEKNVGLVDLAQSQAARFLGSVSNLPTVEFNDPTPLLLDVLLPNRGPEAAAWWRFFRVREPNESATERLKRVLAMLPSHGTSPPLSPELAAAFLANIPATPPKDHTSGLHALAMAHSICGQEDLARRYFQQAIERADNVPNRMKLADFERSQRHFIEAADAYRAAAEKQPTRPLPLYLQARCLAEAGRTDEAKDIAELAFRLSVGKHNDRIQLVGELSRLGLTTEARREREFVLRANGSRDYYAATLQINEAQDAIVQHDYARAADLYDRVLAAYLRFGMTDISTTHSMSRNIRLNRARAELVAGHADGAIAQAEEALRLQPNDVSLPIQLSAGLIKLGRKADADALYKKVAGQHRERLKEFPDSSLLLNNLAWCSACCRRDLDEAFQLATRASQLQPHLPGYFDTLAEVCHQKGDRVAAIAAIKRALTIDPANAYYKSQLRRIETGDRESLPAEPEE
jgi:tetratricopeptide (TPR) repeat protein